MAYVISTSKASTAVTGHASGFFTGTQERYVILNRGNFLSLFSVNETSSIAESIQHIKDFRLFCKVKVLHSVPIIDPENNSILRHVLFLMSVKQELYILSFSLSSQNKSILMTTLFYGHLTELYQSPLTIIDTISCSSDACPTRIVTPFVCIAVTEGYLYFIDILSAIGSQLKYDKAIRSYSQKIFPPSVISLMQERSKWNYNTKRWINVQDYGLRCIALGKEEDGNALSLFILSVDSHDHANISKYTFSLTPNRKPRGSSSFFPADWLFPSRNDPGSRNGEHYQRSVDPTSRFLTVTHDGVIVVGSQLLTFLRDAPGVSKPLHVQAVELPFAGPTASPIASIATLPNKREIIVCTVTGACALVEIQGDRDASHYMDFPKQIKVKGYFKDTGTIPSGIVCIGDRISLLCSSMEDSIVVDLSTMEKSVVIENCGPVVDLTVGGDGASQMVLASTGADRRGGVGALRSVMTLSSEKCYSFSTEIYRLFAVQELLLLCAHERTIMACYRGDGEISEVKGDFSSLYAPSQRVVNLYFVKEIQQYIIVHEKGMLTCSWSDCEKTGLVSRSQIDVQGNIMFSAFNDDVMVTAENASLSIWRTNLECLWSMPTASTISALTIASDGSCIVGQWDRSVSLLDLETRSVLGEIVLDSVPHSIACVSTAQGCPAILIGLINGYLCETTSGLLKEKRYQHYFFLSDWPVELHALEEKRAVISYGAVPMILLVTNEGCEITGFSVDGVFSCGTVVDYKNQSKYVFHSKTNNTLHIGTVENIQKLNRTFINLGGTVTLVRWISGWGGFVIALRRNNRESIMFLPSSTLQNSLNDTYLLQVQQSLLLENEQCTFLGSISLPYTLSDEFIQETGLSMVLAGSGFLFRDEQNPRSSRIMWFSQGTKGELNLIGEKDIKGSLQSCCIIQGGRGSVAVAVSGAVLLFQWNSNEATFLLREKLSVGMLLFDLIQVGHPRSSSDELFKATIAAVDIRRGVFYMDIDTEQGTIEIISRDLALRHPTTAAVLQSGATILSDENDNIFVMDNIEEETTTPDFPQLATKKINQKIKAQIHIGQCINCMERGSFAPAAAADANNQSLSLFRGTVGAQVVFGTDEGSFGTITPVNNSIYYVLRCIEYAILDSMRSDGLVKSDFYRQLLLPGQARGLNRQIQETGQAILPLSEEMQNSKFQRRRFVDGDIVELFLGFETKKRFQVLQVATAQALQWWPTLENMETDKEGKVDFLESSGFRVSETDYIQEKCNELLSRHGLPLLPFTEESVQHLIFDLRRLH